MMIRDLRIALLGPNRSQFFFSLVFLIAITLLICSWSNFGTIQDKVLDLVEDEKDGTKKKVDTADIRSSLSGPI